VSRKYLLLFAVLALPTPLMAQHPAAASSSPPNPVVMVMIIGALALAPFALIMLTSFVKISVVLSILRNALGTQSVPPNQVITGLALVLSFFVMSPVVRQMYNDAGTIADTRDLFSEASVKTVFEVVQKGKEPLRRFLAKHAHDQDRLLFIQLAARLDQSSQNPNGTTPGQPGPAVGTAGQDGGTTESGLKAPDASKLPPQPQPQVDKNDFQILIPSFVTSQLKEAFEVGFLVFVPFIIIDMVVANVLLAMGMSMLSPSVISLPFKLLLFVLVDGWFLLVRALVLSYA
jgi:type III secretion protein R